MNSPVCCIDRGPNLTGYEEKYELHWTRVFRNAEHIIGVNCLNRILCEASCENGGKLTMNQEREYILSEVVVALPDIAQSYFYGMSVSCSKKNTANMCKAACKKMYPQCDSDVQSFPRDEYFYSSWKLFKKMGFWFFSAEALVQEKINENPEEVLPSVETSYQQLYSRLSRLYTAYIDSTDGESWPDYLKRHKDIDATLAESLGSNYGFCNYLKIMRVIEMGLGNNTSGRVNYAPCKWSINESHASFRNEASYVKCNIVLMLILTYNVFYCKANSVSDRKIFTV